MPNPRVIAIAPVLDEEVKIGKVVERVPRDVVEETLVVMAGNNKDWPEEIPMLIDPIVRGDADLVQGSRWIIDDQQFGDMPAYRKFATRLHPWLFSKITRHAMTDTTNGFRAISADALRHVMPDLRQDWLDEYELEVYLLHKTIKEGLRVTEVGVHKTYPPKAIGQTKMAPITGWWSILRPLFLLGFGLKK